jgi:hypothetical protein
MRIRIMKGFPERDFLPTCLPGQGGSRKRMRPATATKRVIE